MSKKKAPEPETTVFDIDPEDVRSAYIRMVPEIATANQEAADALYVQLKAKNRKERVYAALYAEYGDAGDAKRPSEAAIKQAILGNKLYQGACDALADAEFVKASKYGVAEALRVKKDMLVSLGAHVRAELGGGDSGTLPSDDEEEEEDEDED